MFSLTSMSNGTIPTFFNPTALLTLIGAYFFHLLYSFNEPFLFPPNWTSFFWWVVLNLDMGWISQDHQQWILWIPWNPIQYYYCVSCYSKKIKMHSIPLLEPFIFTLSLALWQRSSMKLTDDVPKMITQLTWPKGKRATRNFLWVR